MIADIEQDERDNIGDKVDVVIPPPFDVCVGRESSSKKRSKGCDGAGGEEQKTGKIRSVLIGHQLHQNETERHLNCASKTDEYGSADDGVDVLCSCTGDRT